MSLIKLDLVEADNSFLLACNRINDIRPEICMCSLETNEGSNSTYNSHYATALYFIMNLCENYDRGKYIKQPDDQSFAKDMEAITSEADQAKDKEQDIKFLPVEDNTWFLDKVINSESQEENIVYMCVRDKHELVISFTAWAPTDVSETVENHIYDFLCTTCLFPKVHRPRRPRYFRVRDDNLSKKCTLDLESLGIIYIGECNDKKASQIYPGYSCSSLQFRECHYCHFRAEKEMFYPCQSCGAVLYCTAECKRRDSGEERKEILYCHSRWCEKMKLYMEEEKQLRDLPFDFVSETTCTDFDDSKYREFLERFGVNGQGLWYWACPSVSSITHSYGSNFFSSKENSFVLPMEDRILQNIPPVSPCVTVTDWSSYYSYRGFSLDSPIAVLLQWPLTMYHIITSCLPQDYGWSLEKALDRPVLIDLLGIEQEVDLYPVFQELSHLLPDVNIVINMFGKNISKVTNRAVKVMGRLKMKVYRCLYHKYTHHWTPDVIIGFNAGIAAYPSWRGTIEKLKDKRWPAYFTDYCHHSVDLSREVMREGCAQESSQPIINPYRSPIRKYCDQHLLPWFSNAFIFHLPYS